MCNVDDLKFIKKCLDDGMHATVELMLNDAIMQAEQQESVAWKHDCAALLTNDIELWIDHCPHCGKPRTASKREWQGLTRAERFEIEKAMSKYYDYQHECKTVCLPEFARAIETKLKEKNT